MLFFIGNVVKFFESRKFQRGIARRKKAIIKKAQELAYIGKLSGAHTKEVMQEFSQEFLEALNSREQAVVYMLAQEEFERQDDKLRRLKSRISKILLDGGFNEYVHMKIRGFKILSPAEDMPVYNTVGKLAKENVKDMGVVIMSIGFGEILLDRQEGDKYIKLLETYGLDCRIYKTPDYPKATGAVYVYVKA